MKVQKPLVILILLFPSILFLNSCHNFIEGAGDITPSTVNIPNSVPITEIELKSDFTVYLSRDTSCFITVQGYENLVSHVTVGGLSPKLEIGTEADYVLQNSNIVIYISAPNFTSIKLSSGGSIISTDSIISNTLEVTNNGTGTISLFGDANILNAYSASSGATRLCAFQADTVTAYMFGSGILSTKPIGKLNAQISGSGQIQYIGSPTLSFSITGTGSLLQTLGCY